MKRIAIATKGRTFFLSADEILFCKAAGSYSVIFLTNSEEIITSMNLLKLFERMRSLGTMIRICQSFMVNRMYVKCLHHETREIELYNAKRLPYTVAIKSLEDILINQQ